MCKKERGVTETEKSEGKNKRGDIKNKETKKERERQTDKYKERARMTEKHGE